MGNIKYKLAFLCQPVFSGTKKNTNLPPENWLKGKSKQYKFAFPSYYKHLHQASVIIQSVVYSNISTYNMSTTLINQHAICLRIHQHSCSCILQRSKYNIVNTNIPHTTCLRIHQHSTYNMSTYTPTFHIQYVYVYTNIPYTICYVYTNIHVHVYTNIQHTTS